MIKPKSEGDFTIIACALYSPPKSRKKTKLLNFIAAKYHQLKIKYPDAYFILGGDVNDLNIQGILNISSNFKQIVKKPTRKDKILSVIITDLHQYYKEPEILPPIQPDILGKGKPSDHSTPFAEPIVDWGNNKSRKYETKVIRRMPQSGIQKFGQWIIQLLASFT